MKTRLPSTLGRFVALFLVVGAFACGDGKTEPPSNRPPEVLGDIPPVTLTEGDEVQRSVAELFSDPDGDALTYSATSSNSGVVTASMSGAIITVEAVTEGTATVTVTATDPDGASASLAVSFTVLARNEAPVVTDTIPPQNLTEGDTVTLDVSGNFSDPDGDELTFTVESTNTDAATATIDGSMVTIIAVAEGMATVAVTATDPDDAFALQEVMVKVEAANRAPVVTDTIPAQNLTEGDTVTLDVSGNFSDPDGDELTYTAASSDDTVATVSVSGAEVTVTGVAAGSATVTVTATDPGDLSVTQMFDVTVAVANQSPEAVDTIADQGVAPGDSVTVDVSGNFSDPDGDELTYTAASSDDTVATVSVSGAEVTVTGVAAGSATVTVTATDPGDLSVTQMFDVTVAVANQSPEAVGTIADQGVAPGDSVTVDVSGNFSDPDGDELTYTAASSDDTVATVSVSDVSVTVTGVAAGSATVTVTATDPGDLSVTQMFDVTVAVANQSPEAVGTIADQSVAPGDSVTVDVSGNFSDPDGDELTYTAASSDDTVATVSVSGAEVTVTGVAAGSATVTVTATDPGGLSADQTFDVTVAVANQSPEAVGTIADQSVAPGDSVTVDVSGNFSDPDGDELTYTAASSDDTVATVSVSGAEVTVTGVAAGSATVTVTATDPGDLSVTQMFDVTVAVANQSPEAVDTIADQGVAPGDSVTVDVSGNFSDPDGDDAELTYTAASSDDTVATVSVSGAEVTVTGVAAGSATVTVTATDPGDLSVTQMFDVTVAVANQSPEAVGTIADQGVAPGDSVTVDVSGNFSDPDGDDAELTYTAASSDDTVATVSVSGAEVTVTGVAAGSATVTVTATDPGDLSVTQMFDVTVAVANQSPEAVDTIADQGVAPGDSVTVDVSGNFSDPDGDDAELTYTAASSDDTVATVSVSGAEVTVTGVAAGSATVTVTATDPGDLSVTQMFDVTVAVGNQSPEAVDTIADQGVAPGDSVTVDVSGNFSDPDGDDAELTYTAASSDDTVATVSVSGAEVTVTGVAAGSATVTVTATDPGDLSVTQMFDVTVAVANQSPEAVDTIADQGVAPGDSVTVDVSGNFSDPDGDDAELTYTAASSDDTVATVSVSGAEVTVTGVAAGSATVTVTATDPGDLSVTQMFDVTVAVGNQSPEAVDTIADQGVAPGDSVTVDVSGNFSDPDGDDAELTYTAASSDDTVATVSVSGAEVTVTGVAAGSATVTVTATDPGDLSVTQMFDVTVAVANQSPEAVDTIADQGVAPGDSVTVDVSGNFSDPDGDDAELTYTAASSDDTVATVSVSGAEVTVTGVAAGSATVTVTATDPGDLSVTQMFDVTVAVANQSPEAVDTIADQGVAPGDSVTVDVSGNFSDPDGDDAELTYTAASSDDTVATVSVSGAEVTVTGVAAGSATVTVTATDPGDLSVTQMFDVTVAVANQSPEAVDTIADQGVAPGDSVTVDVSGNFSDPDGDDAELTYTAASSDDTVATVSVSGAEVTVTGVAAGSATVTVTATDPGDLSVTQMFDVTVAVGNQSPEAVDTIADQGVAPGDSVTVDVSGNFSDPDGDDAELTYTAASSDDTVATVSVSGAEVTVTGVAAGSATVTVTATDPGDLSVTQMFDVTVAVANQSPEAVDTIADQGVAPGDSVTVDVSGNFSDPDGDDAELTYTAASSDDTVATVSVSGAEVTVTGVAAGSATVTVTATDPGDLSVTQMFDVTVAVANQSPEAVDTIADQSVAPGDSVTVDVSGNFSDPDGDDAELTYTAASSDDTVATVSVSGAEVTVTGVAAGSATVTVTATDPGDLSVTQMFDVTVAVANQSPEAVDTIADQGVAPGDSVTVDVSGNFSDPDGDDAELTYTAASSDDTVATVSVSGAEVTVTGVAAGSATVTVTATDPGDLSVTQMFDVTVAVANQSPEAVDTIADQGVAPGDSVTVDVSGNFSDPDGDDAELTYTAASSDDTVATVSVSGAEVTVTGVAAGSATVTVTATDPGDLSVTQMFDVTVAVANQSPEAVDTIADQSVAPGDSVTVDVSGNFSDPDGDDAELTYTAASSDDTVATVSVSGAEVTVTGVAAGSATVTVTATDPGDLSVTQMFDVTVAVGNQSPEAVDTIADQGVAPGDSVTVDVSGNFSDPDGDDAELTYTAASSDDTVATVSVSGAEVTVTGVAAGSATVTVTATDPGDLSVTQMFDVTVAVANQSPEAVDTIADQGVAPGDSVTVDVSGNFSDPDGDDAELTYTAASSDDTVATVSVSGAEVTVTGVAAGSATVTVTATDPGDLSVTQMFDVTVAVGNQSPEAVDTIADQGVAPGDSVTVDVSGNFSDPDGDDAELTYTAASSDDTVATVSVSGAEVTVTGVAAGSATVTVTATDPGDLSVTQMFDVTVAVANQSPEAVDTIADQGVAPGDSVTVDVSGNFSDPDGDDAELTYTAASSDDTVATVSVSGAEVTVTGVAAGSATVTVTATDPGDLSVTQMFDVTVAVANQSPEAVDTIADQGVAPGDSVTVDVSGNFSDPDGDDAELTYTAASSDDTVATVSVSGAEVTVTGVAAGSATVTVTATDPGDLSVTQMFDVTVAVANQSPEAVDTIADQGVAPGDSVTVDVSGNFSDPDGDDAELTYTAASSDDTVATVSVSGAEVTVTGVAAGSATVTVTATDPGDLSVTQRFVVTVVVPANQDPVPVGTIDALTVTVGGSEAVDVSGNFSDPDGDTLTYTAASSDDTVATVSVSGAEVTVAGVAAGSATVTVTATDPGGLSATQRFVVTVVVPANQDPVPVGTIDALTVTVGGSEAVDVSGNFSDPDGDSLTYTAASSDDTVATVSVSGAEVTVAGVAAGSATVTVTATDPGGLSATQRFVVTVVVPANQAPLPVGEIADQTLRAGDSEIVDVSVHFSDPDGDSLTYTAASSDDTVATVSVSGAEVTVAGVAAGSATVTVTATDPGGLSADQTFDVTVVVANQSPEAVDTIADQSVAPGESVTVDVSGNFSDPDGDELTYTAASSDEAVGLGE